VGFGPQVSGNQTTAPLPKGNSGGGGPIRGSFPVKMPPMPANNFGPFMPGFSGGQGGSGNFSGGAGGSGGGGRGFGGGMGGSGMLGGGMTTGGFGMGGAGFTGMAGGTPGRVTAAGKVMPLADWARLVRSKPDTVTNKRGQDTEQRKKTLDQAGVALAKGKHAETQAGELGVDLSVQSNQLRNQSRLALTAQRKAAGRTLLEIGGVWIDEGFDPKMKVVTVKAFSPAYFRLLERQPQLRELFRLGNFLVWVTPSGAALVVDREDGQEKLEEAAIDKLFKESKR
jgi:Ca-activated chloride channel family protein